MSSNARASALEIQLDCQAHGWLTSQESPPPAGRCGSEEADSVVHFTLCGQSEHLGDFFMLLSHCTALLETPILNLDGTFVSGAYAHGVMTVIAADGHILTASYRGGVITYSPLELPLLRFRHHFTVTPEGTGRFEGATGSGVQYGTLDRETGRITLSTEGLIHCDSAAPP